jgi:hypothetical protein
MLWELCILILFVKENNNADSDNNSYNLFMLIMSQSQVECFPTLLKGYAERIDNQEMFNKPFLLVLTLLLPHTLC